ncbi:hypothetical protein CGZ88_0966 [Bifidobacterium anseris]|uniref:Uncharacterized protein n=1 Tax=Bifidobacterium anseris TaxID=2020963 RepID=A0A2N5IZQ6_9BIFI|nr:hypothetical protein [Bifidobacterium anseris]PLS27439.1 hypothetical protein CGZ88_0966 [Bifidobacterium anseris]
MAEPVQIDWRKTVEALLSKSRRAFVPIDKSFIQLPRGSEKRKSILSEFVHNGDERGLKAYLLISASISSADKNGKWHTSLPLQAWARAFGCYETTEKIIVGKNAASRILNRLQNYNLIKKARLSGGKELDVELLSQDGSGGQYSRPKKRFVRLSYDFWRKRYDQRLSLAAIAMLLVVLGEKQPCVLPAERMPDWYGWSPDTAERGLRELVEKEVLCKKKMRREAALSPSGYAVVNEYTVKKPFDNDTLNLLRRRQKEVEE